MFYHQASNTYIVEGNGFEIAGVRYPASWLNHSTPQQKAALGLEEVVTVGSREDDRFFWVGETLVGAVRTITNTPKDPAEVAAVQAQIAQQAQDAVDAADIKADAKFQALIKKSPAQAKNWVDNNFPTLTPPERKDLATLVIAIGILGRRL